MCTKKTSTNIKHQSIYTRFKELLCEFRSEVPPRWQSVPGQTMIYAMISDETGYSEDYICRIVNQQRRIEEGSNGRVN